MEINVINPTKRQKRIIDFAVKHSGIKNPTSVFYSVTERMVYILIERFVPEKGIDKNCCLPYNRFNVKKHHKGIEFVTPELLNILQIKDRL